MKKTIAILALAASSFASAGMGTTTFPVTHTPLTLTAVLNTLQVKNTLFDGGTATILTMNILNSTDNAANTVNLVLTNGQITGRHTGLGNSGGSGYSFGMNSGMTDTDIWYGAAATAVTLYSSTYAHGATNLRGTSAVFTIMYHDGHVAHFGGELAGGLIYGGNTLSFTGYEYNGDYVMYEAPGAITSSYAEYSNINAFVTAAQAANEKALAGMAPEPTTATLSLLALAGLAARRRRK